MGNINTLDWFISATWPQLTSQSHKTGVQKTTADGTFAFIDVPPGTYDNSVDPDQSAIAPTHSAKLTAAGITGGKTVNIDRMTEIHRLVLKEK